MVTIVLFLDLIRMKVKRKNHSKNRRLDRLPKQIRDEVEADLSVMAAKIKKARSGKGFTQESLAEALNVEPSTIQAIEQGRGRPSLELLFAIIKVVGFKITLQ